jgi:5-methylcytosine-specific restriction endonuclease McrA
MRKHTQIYLQGMGYKKTDFIPCEVCGRQAVDIHHIKARGMGGSNDKDEIENLMAVCRSCHLEYGDKKQWVDFLIDKHKEKMNDHRC